MQQTFARRRILLPASDEVTRAEGSIGAWQANTLHGNTCTRGMNCPEGRMSDKHLQQRLELHWRHLLDLRPCPAESRGSDRRRCGLLRRLAAAGPRCCSSRADGRRDDAASTAASLPGKAEPWVMDTWMWARVRLSPVQTDSAHAGLTQGDNTAHTGCD